MTNWTEVERLRKDCAAFKGLAARLMARHSTELREWEMQFLESISRSARTEDFSNRQGEKLLEIRDGFEIITKWRGFSVAALLRGCNEARADLSDDDEEWITARFAADPTEIRRRHMWRLLALSRRLGLIEIEIPG